MSKLPSVGILGIGWYLPDAVRENDYWQGALAAQEEERRRRDIFSVDRKVKGGRAQMAPEIARAMEALKDDPFRGARRRHVIDDASMPSDMEAEASRRAMRNAGVRPEDIDMAVVYSVPSDRVAPGNGPDVQAKCGLVNASGWSIDLGCASFQAQLIMAAGLIKSGMAKTLLLVNSCTMSRVMDYSELSSTLFGDGAAALIVGEVKEDYGMIGHYIRTEGSLADGVVIAPVVDGKAQRQWWRHCAPIKLTAIEPELGKTAGLMATEFCKDACMGALKNAGLTIDDVDLYLGSQSTGWFYPACRDALGLPEEKGLETFAEVAALGSATVQFNLDRAYKTGRVKEGDIVLMYSPGAGLSRSAVVYRFLAPRYA